jgi:undecaprenyl-diphosphatase
MNWLQALFLGIVQGITEFLPVSSSGHLVLFQSLFNPNAQPESAQEMFFDGILHLGTLLAVLVYFGRELLPVLKRSLGQPTTESAAAPHETASGPAWPATRFDLLKLLIYLGIATLPAALAVKYLGDHIRASFQKPDVVATNFVILGALLIVTSRLPSGTITGATMTWWHAAIMGLAQGCAAIMRGLSRSGSTLAAALLVGLDRSWAVRFSFMMSVIASMGLGASGIMKAMKDPTHTEWMTSDFLLKTVVATLVSAVVAYLTITPLIAIVKRAKLWMFGLYVWAVAAVYFGGKWLL